MDYMKKLFREHLQQKLKRIPIFQDLPSQKSACGGLNSCPMLGIGMAQVRLMLMSRNKLKKPLLSDDLQSTFVVCTADIQRQRLVLHSPCVTC